MPDFRWLLERTDSPWYPSARLFRQSEIGQWESALNIVLRSLSDYLGSFESIAATRGHAGVNLKNTETTLQLIDLIRHKTRSAKQLLNAGNTDEALARFEVLLLQPDHFDTLQRVGLCTQR